LQDEEEGAAIIVYDLTALKPFANKADNKDVFTFITPAGKPITFLADKLSAVHFSTGDSWVDSKKLTTFGALISFTYDDKSYNAYAKGGSEFTGYKDDYEKLYSDTLTVKLNPTKGIIGFPCYENGNIQFSAYQHELPTQDLNAGEYKNEYVGKGTLKPFNYYTPQYLDFLSSVTPVIIEGQTNDFSDEAKEYLKIRAEYAGSKSSLAMYIFMHATQITRYPNTFYTCEYHDYVANDGLFIDFLPIAESCTTCVQKPKEALLQEYYSDENLLDVYNERDQALKDINALGSISDSDKRLKTVQKVYDEYYCILRELSYTNRKTAIEDAQDDDNTELLLALFETAPIEQAFDLLTLLENEKCKLLYGIWENLDRKEQADFVVLIAKWVRAHRIENDYATKRYEQFFEKENFSKYIDDASIVNENCFFFFKSNWIEAGLLNIFEASYDQSDKIKITHEISPLQDFRPLHYSYDASPLEPILLILKDDFTQYGFKQGDVVAVPAIFVHWLDSEIDRENTLDKIRVLADVAAIATAPLTAGGSTILLTVEIGVATIDIVRVTYEDDIIEYFGEDAQTYLNSWDALVALYGAGLVTKGFITFVKAGGLVRLQINMLKFKDFVASNTAATLLSTRNSLYNMANSLQRFANAGKNVGEYLELMKAVKTIDFNLALRLSNTYNTVSVKFKNAFYAVLIRGNMEYSIARGEYIDNIFTLKEFGLPVTVAEVRYVGQLDNTHYLLDGTKKTGVLEIVEDIGSNGGFYIRELSIPANWASKFSKIDDWLKGISNISNRANIESILKTWDDDLLLVLNNKIDLFPGLKAEFAADNQLLHLFNSLETNWWSKYALGGLAKRTNSILPATFKQMVGEIEVTSLGKKLKLKTVSLDETSASYIGKLFDETVEIRMVNAWKTNNFADLPSSISTQLQSLKSQGYELAVEAKLTINGKNPVPDYLFVKKEIDPLTNVITYDANNVKYIDCKYLWDSPFTTSQLEIVNSVSSSGVANTVATQGIKNVDDVQMVVPNASVKIKSVQKLTVNQQMEMVIQ